MPAFAPHSITTAPAGARERLAATEQMFGFVPNVFAVLAESPTISEGFETLHSIFAKSAFSPTEREWDFKFNTRKISDAARTALALKGIEGKRLTYRRSYKATHA